MSAFFFAIAWVSLPLGTLAAETFLGTSFYLSTFFEVETFFTTTTFSVFLAGTCGFFTGAGCFLTYEAITYYFLGLTIGFFSIFLDAFLICKALFGITLDLDSFTFVSLDLDSFTFASLDLDSINFESLDLDFFNF